MTPPVFDYTSNTYLTVYLSASSSYLADPSSIITIHPALTHIGPVGVMKDVQIVSIPNHEWDHSSDDVLASFREKTGIEKVEVQDGPKTRVKRGDEL